jgi:hypothetical protein
MLIFASVYSVIRTKKLIHCDHGRSTTSATPTDRFTVVVIFRFLSWILSMPLVLRQCLLKRTDDRNQRVTHVHHPLLVYTPK